MDIDELKFEIYILKVRLNIAVFLDTKDFIHKKLKKKEEELEQKIRLNKLSRILNN